ncbi:MAG: TonB-dependent receptor [Pseudomonadota bacterium]
MAGLVASHASAQQTFDLPAQPLADALASLSQQTGLAIDFGGVDLSGLQGAEVISAASPQEALEALLVPTGLEAVFVGPSVVRLRQTETKAAPTKPENRPPNRRAFSEDVYPRYLEPVRVTATKRDLLTSDVPTGVTVFSGEDLLNENVRDMGGLVSSTPGAVVTNLGASRNKIFLRGISDGAFFDRTQSTVGVYLGETQIIFSDTNPDLRLVDMEQVEILRGPQSSLFGSGNLGGVLRLDPNRPDLVETDFKLGARISSTQDGGFNTALDSVVNLPIVANRLALRASAYFDHESGYIDNPQLSANNINETTIAGGRILSDWSVTPSWSLETMAGHQFVDANDGQYVDTSLGDLQKATRISEPYEDSFSFFSIGLKGEWLGADITSSTAITHRDSRSTFDASEAFPFLFEDPSDALPVGAPGVFTEASETVSFTHESRLRYIPNSEVDVLIGVFGASRQVDVNSELSFDRAALTDLQQTEVRQDDINEAALFGDLSYSFSPRWSATIGGRYSVADFSTDIEINNTIPPDDFRLSQSHTEDSWTPNASVSYSWNKRDVIYARATKGFRVGGFNINSPPQAVQPGLSDGETTDFLSRFASDELWSFELGTKADVPRLPLRIEAAAFNVYWNDVQSDLILGNGSPAIVNAGDAEIFGVETAFSAIPFSWLDVSGHVTWSDARLSDPNPSIASTNSRLPIIPEVVAGLRAEGRRKLTPDWSATARFDLNYVGSANLLFEEDEFEQGDYTRLNIDLAVRKERFQVSLFAENLLDEEANTFAFGNPFSLSARNQATPLRPRTIGVALRIASPVY